MNTLLHFSKLIWHELNGEHRYLICFLLLLAVGFSDSVVYILFLFELFAFTTVQYYRDNGRKLLTALQQESSIFQKQRVILTCSLLFVLFSCYSILIMAILLKNMIVPVKEVNFSVAILLLSSLAGLSSCIWMIPNFNYHLVKQKESTVIANSLWHYFVAFPGALLILISGNQQFLSLATWTIAIYTILACSFLLCSLSKKNEQHSC